MSETIRTLAESLLMIGAFTAGLVWYAVVAGRREDAEPRETREKVRRGALALVDPDAHLGHSGAE